MRTHRDEFHHYRIRFLLVWYLHCPPYKKKTQGIFSGFFKRCVSTTRWRTCSWKTLIFQFCCSRVTPLSLLQKMVSPPSLSFLSVDIFFIETKLIAVLVTCRRNLLAKGKPWISYVGFPFFFFFACFVLYIWCWILRLLWSALGFVV